MSKARFGARLRAAMDARGPLCVGIDPHPALLAAWDLPDAVTGLRRFTDAVVDAVGSQAAVVKPQSAFFERFGARGIAVLEDAVCQLRDAGALVLLDVKRGDIATTVAAYADAYLNPASPLWVDAITASPYLGFGSLQPMLDTAEAHGGGVFVLALTSNPQGPTVQHARTADGRTVAQHIIDEASALNEDVDPLGDVGIVVGATIGQTGHDFSALNGPILVPGLGAQGGRPEDLRAIFGDDLSALLPTYSREILTRGPSWAGLHDELARLTDACREAVGR